MRESRQRLRQRLLASASILNWTSTRWRNVSIHWFRNDFVATFNAKPTDMGAA